MLDRLHDASGYGEHRTRARTQVGGLSGHGELDVADRDEHSAGHGTVVVVCEGARVTSPIQIG